MNRSTANLTDDGALGLAAGVGIITMTLFPLAIPLLALTAVALIPLLLIPLAGGLIAIPVLLLRRLLRTGALLRERLEREHRRGDLPGGRVGDCRRGLFEH